MYEQFVREMAETTDEKETWKWLKKNNLKVETKALLSTAQQQVIRTNYIKHKIDKAKSSLFRMRGKKSEKISQIVSEWENLAQQKCNSALKILLEI